MSISKISVSKLTETQKNEIRTLIRTCADYEAFRYAEPDLDDPDAFAYLFCQTKQKKKQLTSILLLYPMEEYFDAAGYTHPKARHQGFFSELLSRFLEEEEEPTLHFLANSYSYDSLSLLDELECECSGTEHIMERMVTAETPTDHSENSSQIIIQPCQELSLLARLHSCAFELTQEESQELISSAFESGDTAWLFSKKGSSQPESIGMCLCSDQEEACFLYAFCLIPSVHRQGLGTAALRCLMATMAAQNPQLPLRLQVTEENEAAFGLYRKCGFYTTEEYMEYWY